METIHLATVCKETLVEIKKEFLGYMIINLNPTEMRLFLEEKSKDFLTADQLLERFFKPKEPRVYVFNWTDSKKHLHINWMIYWIPEGLDHETEKLWKEVAKQPVLHNFVDNEHKSVHHSRDSIEKLLKSK